MGNVFLHGKGGGGGAAGGFELTIVGGTTRPAKASQNTIWIDTDAEITDYVFSATEPENSIAGMVWVTIGDSGSVKTVSPVGGDWITVYPLCAKQLIDGAWVDKPTKSYQYGMWVDWWNGELYNSGNEYESVTGGWVGTAAGYDSSAKTAVEPVVTRGSASMLMKTSGDGGSMIHTANKINLAQYSQLVFDGKVTGATAYSSLCNLRVWSDIGPYSTSNAVATAALQNHGDGEVILDISALNKEYYIGFGLWASGAVEMRSMRLK